TFGTRLLAFLVDCLILFIPGIILHMGVPFAGPICIGFLYYPIFHASPLQATIGKKAFGIKVTDSQGRPLTIQMALLRYLVAIASTCMLFAGHLVALFTAKRQALHDLVADSVVIEGVNETVRPFDAWVTTVRRIFGGDETAVGPIFRSGEAPKNSQG